MSLKQYWSKRNFSKTKEPEGDLKTTGYRGLFVVQLHHASHLHYDFRLKIGNTLKSWAIPKGPSMKTLDKRLAVETEDHPLSYANFEGVIPEKQYGAGVVLIWDRGIFKNITTSEGKKIAIKKAYENGHMIVELHGQKLKGKFVLKRFRAGKNNHWILIKMKDEHADNSLNITKMFPESVVSGATLKDIRN